jgi:antitoxin component YwqK of YwqJK toxin-antitoxin module
MKKWLLVLLTLFPLMFFNGCEGPSLGGNVKREYFPNGQILSEFYMSDSTGQNGLLKRYGPDEKLTSTVTIQNGVKNGIETLYDPDGRKLTTIPYVNGKKNGAVKLYYPNGDIAVSMSYRNGILHGDAYKYDISGRVLEHRIYRNGRVIN